MLLAWIGLASYVTGAALYAIRLAHERPDMLDAIRGRHEELEAFPLKLNHPTGTSLEDAREAEESFRLGIRRGALVVFVVSVSLWPIALPISICRLFYKPPTSRSDTE